MKALLSIADRHAPETALMAVYAKTLAQARGDIPHAVVIAEQRNAPSRVQAVLKAAVAAGTTTDASWARPLVDHQVVVAAFISMLRNTSAFYRLLDQGMVRIPFNTIAASVVSTVGAAIVGEGKPIPLSSMQLEGASLEERKAVAMVVLTDDLVRSNSPAAEALISRELRRAVTGTVDAEFFTLITDGSTPTAVSTGADGAAAKADLRALLDAVEPTAESRLLWVMSPDVARQAATLENSGESVFPDMSPTGGEMLNVPAMVSDQMAPGTIGLVDATGLAGEADTITLDASSEAMLQMDSTPTDPVTASTTMISLWQMNMTSFRAAAYFGVERLRSNAWAIITGVSWNGQV